MNIDPDKFFAELRRLFGSLKQSQVDAVNELLMAVADDESITDKRQMAYVWATAYHETAFTFEPVAEYGRGKGHAYGKKDAQTGQAYYGRGYVQLTWLKNYAKFTDLLGVDLVHNPDLALEPHIAFQVLIVGMREGLFTGRKLTDYINPSKCDYLNARRIVNGMDKAAAIKGYAEKFEKVLGASGEHTTETSPIVNTGSPENALETTFAAKAADTPQDSAASAQAVTVVQGAASETQNQPPIVSTPDQEPIQATSGGFKSWLASVVSWITGAGAGIVALVKDNTTLLIIAAVVIVIAGLAVFIRQTILDRERMRLASDPTKFTVR